MIEIPFLFLEFIYTAIWVVVRICIWMKKKHIDWKREVLLLLIYVNFAVIIRYTFFPMAKVDGRVAPLLLDVANVFPFRVNVIPFVNLFDYGNKRDLLLNVIGNMGMFFPSGIVLPIVYKRLNAFWKVLVTGMCISFCIEIIQLPFSVRATDIDDLILNTIGVVVGYGIYSLVCCFVKKLRDLSTV